MRLDLPAIHHNDIRGGLEGFGDIVRDIQCGNVALRKPGCQWFQYGVLQIRVEAGKGLVEKDEVRGGDSEGSGEVKPAEDPGSLQEMADMARDYIASLPVKQFPTMVALADEFAFADPDERFELLLDIFIDGLARRAAAG